MTLLRKFKLIPILNTDSMMRRVALVFSSIILTHAACGQGTFENLNFEEANPVPIPPSGTQYYPYAVTEDSALPHWSVTYGATQQSQITENDPSAGSTWTVLIGPGATGSAPGSDYPLAALDGNYSVLLQGGLTAASASISQTAVIPIFTQSLFFDAEPGSGSLRVSLNGQTIPFTQVGTAPNHTIYGADLSAWENNPNAVTLTFSSLQSSSGLNNWLIDDITFSPQAVPEPSPLILTALGGLVFTIYRQTFQRKR